MCTAMMLGPDVAVRPLCDGVRTDEQLPTRRVSCLCCRSVGRSSHRGSDRPGSVEGPKCLAAQGQDSPGHQDHTEDPYLRSGRSRRYAPQGRATRRHCVHAWSTPKTERSRQPPRVSLSRRISTGAAWPFGQRNACVTRSALSVVRIIAPQTSHGCSKGKSPNDGRFPVISTGIGFTV